MSISKWRPVGNRVPDSHELTVAIETPKSWAIVFSGTLFFSRQLRNAVAKLARMSQWRFDFGATAEIYTEFASQGKSHSARQDHSYTPIRPRRSGRPIHKSWRSIRLGKDSFDALSRSSCRN